jgi:hypothetical protein
VNGGSLKTINGVDRQSQGFENQGRLVGFPRRAKNLNQKVSGFLCEGMISTPILVPGPDRLFRVLTGFLILSL